MAIELPNTIEEIDKAIEQNIAIIKKGRPTYSALEIQLARDGITKLNAQKAKVDHEIRKPFIKVVDTNQPKGNSSVNVNRTRQRYTVNPSGNGGIVGTL